ncbi:uncharacterized [Tachysurus ichikawai]
MKPTCFTALVEQRWRSPLAAWPVTSREDAGLTPNKAQMAVRSEATEGSDKFTIKPDLEEQRVQAGGNRGYDSPHLCFEENFA